MLTLTVDKEVKIYHLGHPNELISEMGIGKKLLLRKVDPMIQESQGISAMVRLMLSLHALAAPVQRPYGTPRQKQVERLKSH
jgi:hypothetical protein